MKVITHSETECPPGFKRFVVTDSPPTDYLVRFHPDYEEFIAWLDGNDFDYVVAGYSIYFGKEAERTAFLLRFS